MEEIPDYNSYCLRAEAVIIFIYKLYIYLDLRVVEIYTKIYIYIYIDAG